MACLTSSPTAVLVSLTLALAGCSESSASGDAGVGDGGHPLDAVVDASTDAAPSDTGADIGMDAPSDADVDALAPDAGPAFVCTAPPYLFACDGMSRDICTAWAQRIGARWSEPVAVCVQAEYEGGPPPLVDGCGRADTCDDFQDIATCHCGGDVRCGEGEVCARERAGDPLRCLPCNAD